MSAPQIEESLHDRLLYYFDIGLISLTSVFLLVWFIFRVEFSLYVLATLSFVGLFPVILSAIKSLREKRVSVDLLASVALGFSLYAHEWSSASFITLMLAFARIFDHMTEQRTKRIIGSLMKFKVEKVRIRAGETLREISVKEVKPGMEIVVEAGDRMPVDGVVISGQAEVNESSLTGESELVEKKAGDKVFTSTMSEAGSIVVRAEKVGADTTLSRIIALVEEASRHKSRIERMADTFTQWYIVLAFGSAIVMYFIGLSVNEILAILLVVCADDIAVAVPLAFTAAIARSAKRGIIVKGSAAFEQLSRAKYILTDKTGTLTQGKPKVVGVKAYGARTADDVLKRAVMGASESHHTVSRAILEYATSKGIPIHAPHESQEVSGQGVIFRHDGEHMMIGRLSFMEFEGVHVSEEVKKDIEIEKNAGRGIALLALRTDSIAHQIAHEKSAGGGNNAHFEGPAGKGGSVIGLFSYSDQLRLRAKEVIAETKSLGVKEWHMLTGDNEHVAAAVAGQLGISHYHANMTPESKLEFAARFERSHKADVVAYIGDGVNDAATLALVDVSVAMGGIGADAAIEASDITIMHDRLYRLPEVFRAARQVRSIMWQCFIIWAITNVIGLIWVTVGIPGLGVLGPAGAAMYNFVTDFFPIADALRAGRYKKSV